MGLVQQRANPKQRRENMANTNSNRRDFLKVTAAGATGALVGFLGPAKVFGAPAAWTSKMAINPNIDNLRVVCCSDPTMVANGAPNWNNATAVGNAVSRDRVFADMDEMAKSLANKTTAGEAWGAIFQMPAGKSAWSNVKVAIKVNCISPHRVNVHLLDKLCRELNALGVPFANITIGDPSQSSTSAWYGAYVTSGRLPSGVSFNLATADLTNGNVDLLINTAVYKTHWSQFGCITLTMKNHYGFFPVDHGATTAMDTLSTYSKSDAIMGTGTPPRQQLCIVDSLWHSTSWAANPSLQQNMLIMGTFTGAVDFCFVHDIHPSIYEAENDPPKTFTLTERAIQDRYLTDFGYTASDFQNLHLVSVPPAGGTGLNDRGRATQQAGGVLNVKTTGSAFLSTGTHVNLPSTTGELIVDVLDISGRQLSRIAALPYAGRSLTVTWDGIARGRTVSSGPYVIRARIGSSVTTSLLSVTRR
jgi:hypothetical protein